MKTLAGVGLYIILTWANFATASSIFVDRANTTGPWNGSAVHPFRHIQDGVTAAFAGDTVNVAVGTYNETVTLNGKNITLTSTNPPITRETTIINAVGFSRGLDISGTGSACHVRGFTVNSASSTGIFCNNSVASIDYCTFTSSGHAADISKSTSTTSPIFTNCTFTSSGVGVYCGDSAVPTLTNCLIQYNTIGASFDSTYVHGGLLENCTVAYNTSHGIVCLSDSYPRIHGTSIEGNGGDGVSTQQSGPNLSNCVIIDNEGTGFNGGAGDNSILTNCLIVSNHGNGVNSINGEGSQWATHITNCTIANNTGTGVYCSNYANATVTNSIVYYNAASLYSDIDSSLAISYSCIAGGWSGTGNINSDPLFADRTNTDVYLRDYHVLSRYGRWLPAYGIWLFDTSVSPCIDAGDPASDYSNELCRNGSRINMGFDGNTREASLSGVGLTCSDLNRDMVVNFEDITLLAQAWMDVDWFGEYDFDRSGQADFGDFAQVAANWLTFFEPAIFTLDQVSGTTATNSSLLTTNGVLIGTPVWTTGRTGNALRLDAITEALQISTQGMNAAESSICLWVYPQSFGTGSRYIIGHSSTAGAYNNRIQLYMDNSGWLGLGMGTAHSVATSIYQLGLNNWYHVALTWNDTTCSVYVNGDLKLRTTFSGLTQLGTFLDIGNDGNTSDRNEAMNGKVEDVHVFSYRLCGGEVWQLYAQ